MAIIVGGYKVQIFKRHVKRHNPPPPPPSKDMRTLKERMKSNAINPLVPYTISFNEFDK